MPLVDEAKAAVLPGPADRSRSTLTPSERIVAEKWGQVLELVPATLSVDDDFFELGGHSMLVAKVALALTDELRVEVPLRTLFEHPTLGGLAEEIDKLV
jgi:acyl carrier protein